MRTLPPHSEVRESLVRLRDAGLRLATLTNSTQQVAEAQLTDAGLIGFFWLIAYGRFASPIADGTPAAAIGDKRLAIRYLAAKSLGAEPGGIRLVAAHIWDVAGAMRAGCAAAFVARPGMVLDPLAEPPDVEGPDLRVVAERILEIEKPAGQ